MVLPFFVHMYTLSPRAVEGGLHQPQSTKWARATAWALHHRLQLKLGISKFQGSASRLHFDSRKPAVWRYPRRRRRFKEEACQGFSGHAFCRASSLTKESYVKSEVTCGWADSGNRDLARSTKPVPDGARPDELPTGSLGRVNFPGSHRFLEIIRTFLCTVLAQGSL